MLTTTAKPDEQSGQEAGKSQFCDSPVEILLDRYFQAHREGADERALHRLEEAILKHIKNFIKRAVRREDYLREDFEDLCQDAESRIVIALRDQSKRNERIIYFFPWARTVIANVVAEKRREKTPWRIMTGSVRYIVTDSPRKDRFAFWRMAAVWLIGLRSYLHKQSDQETARYRDFCRDDTPFVQWALQGRHPADAGKVKLWELLEKFLMWIEMPLEEKQLVTHLLQLRPFPCVTTVSLADIGEDFRKPGTETDTREVTLDWSRCWEEIRALRPRIQAALLLSLKPEVRKTLIAQIDPGPYMISLLKQAGVKKDISQAIGAVLQNPEVKDEDIAFLLETSVGNIHTMRCRYKEHLEKRLGKSIFL